VSVLRDLGNGTFAPATSYATGMNPSAVVVAALNGDARPDLAVASGGSHDVNVLLDTCLP
jgi:hypothetical protein